MYAAAKAKLDAIAKPLDSLGVFEDIIARCGAILGTPEPELRQRAIITMIADNGVVAEGISQSGQDVTAAVAISLGKRKSSVCRMAKVTGTDMIPVDIGVNGDDVYPGVLSRKVMKGTRDFYVEPAMTEDEVMEAISVGIELAGTCKGQGYTMLGTGEMGIGNTTTSCAVCAALLGMQVKDIVGRGAGASDAILARKTDVIIEGIRKYGFSAAEDPVDISLMSGFDPGMTTYVSEDQNALIEDAIEANEWEAKKAPDPFEVLRCVGGLDIAGLVGVFIGGALFHIPVVIDGVISGAAALLAEYLVPGTKEFMIASHLGAEPALPVMLEKLGLTAVIDARLALGEGTGCAMFMAMLDTALAVCEDPTNFDDIAVEQYVRFDEEPTE